MRAYYKEENGSLVIGSAFRIDGQIYSSAGAPLFPTKEKVKLLGWPDDEVSVYETEAGCQCYIAA